MARFRRYFSSNVDLDSSLYKYVKKIKKKQDVDYKGLCILSDLLRFI